MKRLLVVTLAAAALAGCADLKLPLSKPQPGAAPPPLPDAQSLLVRPPWEAFIKAGPGAENDIDLETLNGPNTPPPAEMAADMPSDDEAAPAQTAEKPAKPAANPDAIVIRAVAVPQVKGALGKGNAELTAAMRAVLAQAGWPVLKAARKDAILIEGNVVMMPEKGGQQVVQLFWVISTPTGKIIGDLKQENTVPAGSLAVGWGENARLATEAAAEGIFKLIQAQR